MKCSRCSEAVAPGLTNIMQLNLHHIGLKETLSKLSCANCKICISLRMTSNNWENVDSLLRKQRKGNGWKIIEEDEFLALYILGQILYNEIERKADNFSVQFDFPDRNDIVKILWNDGNAIGFYTVKAKGSIVFDTMESYGMTTLDTAFIRKEYRKNGFGLSILEDIAKTYPKEDIGISTPISSSMRYVVHKFLQLNPIFKTKLWEISGVGSEGNRKLIYLTLKKTFSTVQKISQY